MNSREQLFQMRLNDCRIVCLTQYFKQIIVTNEVESGELLSFLFQIVVQGFLAQI